MANLPGWCGGAAPAFRRDRAFFSVRPSGKLLSQAFSRARRCSSARPVRARARRQMIGVIVPRCMTKAEFTAELARLRQTFARGLDNPQSFNCKDCEDCHSCNFCSGCQNCYRCTHCESCRGCSSSTHCKDSVGCHECTHCERSEGCRGSAYLVDCHSCSDCTYCYGCVGLVKKEFHILNVGYDRKTYFAKVKELNKELNQLARGK
jgi:hypothetical protein